MGKVVLVVEDDDVIRDMLVMMLSADGHEVMTAESVTAARGIIFARPDAQDLYLVIDVVLAHESGIEFAQELMKRYPGFRVLLISGFTDDVVLGETELGGRVAFLPKPFTRDDLLRAFDAICSS